MSFLGADFINCDSLQCNTLAAETIAYLSLQDLQVTDFEVTNNLEVAGTANVNNLVVTGTTNIETLIPDNLTCTSLTTGTLNVAGVATIATLDANTISVQNLAVTENSNVSVSNLDSLTVGTLTCQTANMTSTTQASTAVNLTSAQLNVGQLTVNNVNNGSTIQFNTQDSGVVYQFNVNNTNVAEFSTEQCAFSADVTVNGNLTAGGLSFTQTENANVIQPANSNVSLQFKAGTTTPLTLNNNGSAQFADTVNMLPGSQVTPTGESVTLLAQTKVANSSNVAVSCSNQQNGNGIFICPSLAGGNYNPIVTTGDAAIVSSNINNTPGTGNLVLCPHSSTASGIVVGQSGLQFQYANTSISITNSGITLTGNTTNNATFTINGNLTVTGETDIENVPDPQSINVENLTTETLTASNAVINALSVTESPYLTISSYNGSTSLNQFVVLGPRLYPLVSTRLMKMTGNIFAQNLPSQSGALVNYETQCEYIFYPENMPQNWYNAWKASGGLQPNTSGWQNLQESGSLYKYVLYPSGEDNTRAYQVFSANTSNNTLETNGVASSTVRPFLFVKAFGAGNYENVVSWAWSPEYDQNGYQFIQPVAYFTGNSAVASITSTLSYMFTISGLVNCTKTPPS